MGGCIVEVGNPGLALIRREWAMPNACTFSVLPIRALLEKYLKPEWVVVDPFARDSKIGTWRNDLNPETSAEFHMDAVEFCEMLRDQGVIADAAIFDPPYSPRQIADCYRIAGLKTNQQATQSARLYRQVREVLSDILRPGGLAFSFGWNSAGFGKAFDIREILLVAHGGAHNDTICVVSQKATNAHA